MNLHDNEFTGIPDSIGELKSLETLNLYDNEFTVLLENIGGLSSLTTLDIDGNNISSLPKSLEELTSLTTLDATDNNLTEIEALLPSTVRLSIHQQTLSLNNFTYAGADVVIEDLPQITMYNRLSLIHI